MIILQSLNNPSFSCSIDAFMLVYSHQKGSQKSFKLLGDGAVAQYFLLNKGSPGSEPFLSVNFGYGCAVTFGAYIAAGVSGENLFKLDHDILVCYMTCIWCVYDLRSRSYGSN